MRQKAFHSGRLFLYDFLRKFYLVGVKFHTRVAGVQQGNTLYAGIFMVDKYLNIMMPQ
jgi:hypothetical protein